MLLVLVQPSKMGDSTEMLWRKFRPRSCGHMMAYEHEALDACVYQSSQEESTGGIPV